MNRDIKIYVAGHRGMVGSAIERCLRVAGYNNLITCTRDQLNLLDQQAVHKFLSVEQPDYIFIAAARVGGIYANNAYRAEFIYQNLTIETNLIHGAYLARVQKLMFLGSSCIYPRNCPQPIREEYLLTGPLERTNEPYALAKIAGIKLCESYNQQYGTDYRSLMPTNLYGPGDNYHSENSHVIPALIRRFHEGKINQAKEVVIWGTGTPRREFLYVDDMAAACVHVMHESCPIPGHINVGSGSDITIAELAHTVAGVVGYKGKINFDPNKPDGTPRKILDSSRLKALGWQPRIGLEEGLWSAYQDFRENHYATDY